MLVETIENQDPIDGVVISISDLRRVVKVMHVLYLEKRMLGDAMRDNAQQLQVVVDNSELLGECT